MEKYSPAEQGIAANVFHLLVTPSGTKIAHSARDLADYAGVGRDELLPILRRLSTGSNRILRPVTALPGQPDDPRYEIFHDRLGPTILDWRSRYLRDQEQAKVTRLEAERRRLKATLSKRDDEGPGEFDLRLMFSLNDVSGIPTEGKNLIIVAAVNHVLHFRIFGGDGKVVVDTDETRLPEQARQIEDLRKQLESLWPLHEITRSDTGWVVTAVTSIVGHTRLGSTIEPEVGPNVDLSAPDGSLPYNLINDKLRRPGLIFLLGWGASIAGREPSQAWSSGSLFPPSRSELARYLAQQIDFPSKDESNNLELVASYFEAMTDRMHLTSCLRAVFDRDFPISSLHRYLASLHPPLIFTTSFDTTLERAFEDVLQPYDVLVTLTESRHAYRSVGWLEYGSKEPKICNSRSIDIDLSERSVIFKIFGSMFRHNASWDSFLVTASDYVDFFSNIEYGIPDLVRYNMMRTGGFLFLEWGLRDWMMRELMYQLLYPKHIDRSASISSSCWAVQHQPGPLDVELWHSLKVKVYNVGLDTFATTLSHAASETDH